jgi:NADPH2:quinone reductase
MRAVVVTRFGGPDVLDVRDVPSPTPGAGDVIVDVEAAGVNYRDVYEREGRSAFTPPFVAGVEGVGRVAAVGDGVEGMAMGARVAWAAAQGSYAEQVIVRADRAVAVPDDVSSELAVAALLQGMTAQYLTSSAYVLQPGDDVLVHAVGGGVGMLLVQAVKLRGGRVIGTTSTDEKAQRARELGADEVIDYDGFADRVRELTAGRGVAVVYDGVGRATFDGSLASLKPRGSLVLFGSSSGPVSPFDPMRLEDAGSLFLTRPSLRHYTATREDLVARAGEVFRWLADGTLAVHVGARYPLEQARQAHEDLEGRRTSGKLLLVP